MVCAGSTSLSISGPSTQRLAGQIRPVKPFHPAAIRLLELMCNSLCGLYQKLWRALVYMNWMGQLQTPQQGCHCWELQDEPFAFCGRNGAAYVDLLSRVFSTHLIGFLLRATKQERKSALKRLRYYVSPKECFLGRRPRQCFLQVNEKTLQQVETFKYLGMVVTSDGCRNK